MINSEPSRLHRPLTIFVPHCSDMLTDHLPHGDGQVAFGFLTNLARRGHTLHVAAESVSIQREIPANLHLYPLGEANGAKGRALYMLRMRRLFKKLRRIVKFDLVHQTNPVFAGISLSVADSGLPTVLGTYVARWANDPNTISARPGMISRVFAMSRDAIAIPQQLQADMLLLTSQAAYNRLPMPKKVAPKIRRLEHGIDEEFFSPAPHFLDPVTLTHEQNNPTVLFLANISLRKGILPLLDAWKHVLEKVPAARLTVAGSGPNLPDAQQRANELGIAHAVEFIGHQERVSTPALYRRHAIYVLPSLGEPYATSVIEAMSCGRPIIITNGGGLPDLVPKEGGLRVPVGNSVALAASIVELLNDSAQRAAMAQFNREYVLNTLTWKAVIDKLEGYYGELVPSAKA